MVALAVLLGVVASDPVPTEMVFEAGPFKRLVQLQPHLRTRRIENTKTGDALQFDRRTPEFIVETTDGRRFTTEDFTVVSADLDRIILRHSGDARLGITIDHSKKRREALCRCLTLAGFGPIQRLVVEAMKVDVRAELGGLGQPLFLNGRWFAGLEHPAGINSFDLPAGCLALLQHPSKTESMTAVIGGLDSDRDRLEDAFERYVDSIRRRRPEPTLQYNTWFDLRGPELTVKNAKDAAEVLHRKLLEPHGLNLQSFVIDDGWQEPKSLWAPRGEWKDGLPELSQFLSTHRAALGLWMPLNGASLDVSWGVARGYRRTNHRKDCYCLSSTQYRTDFREVLRGYAPRREGKTSSNRGVAFFKHDFNYLACSADGHGHLPTPEHGREANVDGQLDLLREAQPDLVPAPSAVTSNAWPSPYWLTHTDFLWIGSYDYSEDWSVPCWSRRQAETTFRDGQIHRLLRVDRTPVPMNALMTHGLIRGRHEGADADRDLDDWADYVMMFLGRGVMLQELYLTPGLLSDEEWTVLGRALVWARERADVLKHTRMIGGRPDAGEPYGYIHWGPNSGIACLRNPSPRPTKIELSTSERPASFPKHAAWTALQIYPDRRKLPDLSSGRPWRVDLAGHQVAIIEFHHDGFLRDVLDKAPPGTITTSADPHGVTTIASATPGRQAMAVLRNDPDRLTWNFNAQMSPNHSGELIWWTHPNEGVTSSVNAMEAVRPPTDLAGPLWSLHRAPLGATKAGFGMSMRLPWSPFWPQEAKAWAVVRTAATLTEQRSVTLPPPLTPLPEVRPSHRGHVTEETLVLDGWRFHRRRSWPEKLGWLLLLGTAPVAVTGLAGRRLGAKLGRPRVAAALAAAALVAVYTLTPLGAALGRVLGEF